MVSHRTDRPAGPRQPVAPACTPPLRRTPVAATPSDIFKIIFAIILPPLGVFLEVGFKGHFWLSILLTLLGFIPGIIHALYVILKH